MQRKFNEFTYLDNDIQDIFNSKNFPKNQAPKIIDIANKVQGIKTADISSQ